MSDAWMCLQGHDAFRVEAGEHATSCASPVLLYLRLSISISAHACDPASRDTPFHLVHHVSFGNGTFFLVSNLREHETRSSRKAKSLIPLCDSNAAFWPRCR